MPIGLNVDNPQSQVSEPVASTSTGGITFGGNVLGGGSTSTTPTSDLSFSTILLYGAIALVVIWILKKIGS
jgi:hypothetical protein